MEQRSETATLYREVTGNSVYDLHDKAFAGVSAYVVLSGSNERVATIAFKYPRDGAGRLYCYLHVLGQAMVRGFASGYGYDKLSAAIAVASRKLQSDTVDKPSPEALAHSETVAAIRKAVSADAGYDWSRELENAGFKVLQAV